MLRQKRLVLRQRPECELAEYVEAQEAVDGSVAQVAAVIVDDGEVTRVVDEAVPPEKRCPEHELERSQPPELQHHGAEAEKQKAPHDRRLPQPPAQEHGREE